MANIVAALSRVEQQKVYDPNTMTWVAMLQPSTTGGGGGGSVTVTNMIPAVETGLAKDTTLQGIATTLSGVLEVDASSFELTVISLKMIPVSGNVSSAATNVVLTPTSGKKLRIYYLAYNPANPTDVAFQFGVSGPQFLFNNIVVGGSIIAKDFGDLRYVEGSTDESLYLYLSNPVSTNWNAFYIEV